MVIKHAKYNINQFTFDYNNDIIKFVEVPLYELNSMKNVYCYGYKFEDGIDKDLKASFIKYINNLNHKDECFRIEIFNFLTDIIDKLNKNIKLNKIDIVLYPERKPEFVRNILMHIYNYISPKFKTVESVKDEISKDYCVINKYKPMHKNYDKIRLENSNVLIVDDINTSGSTITECLRLINSVNSDSKKVVFTLIGGETHKM